MSQKTIVWGWIIWTLIAVSVSILALILGWSIAVVIISGLFWLLMSQGTWNLLMKARAQETT